MVDWSSILKQLVRWNLSKKSHLCKRPTDSEKDNVFDVIIIGAGISGMSTAALLAQFGLHVCVVERGEKPGGMIGSVCQVTFLLILNIFPPSLKEPFKLKGKHNPTMSL